MREMKGVSAWIMGILYVAFVGWSLYGAVTPIETYIFRMIHLGFIFALAFPAYPMLKSPFPRDGSQILSWPPLVSRQLCGPCLMWINSSGVRLC